jgi:hypothetical protein
MAIQTVTLRLPEAIYWRAQCTARAAKQPVEEVLVQTITTALPPLDDVPPEMVDELAALAALGDESLGNVAREVMSSTQETLLHDLLDKQGRGVLTKGERRKLDDLMQEYGRIMLRKAHAYTLLARRGHKLPSREELRAAN